MTTAAVQIHPAADIFPMMDGPQFDLHKADIEANGQRDPVEFYDGKILDGRNRWRACEELGIEADTVEIEPPEGFDPVAYVISKNLHRRQLKTSQKAMCAAKLAGLPHGGNRSANLQIATAEQAAEMFGVSVRSVSAALDVLRNGCEQLIKLCEQGKLSVSAAVKFIELVPKKSEQAKIAKDGAKAVRDDMKTEDEVEEEDGDEQEWSFTECLCGIRIEVMRWKRICPKEHRIELRRALEAVLKQLTGEQNE